MGKAAGQSKRLSREQWLHRALEVLAREGSARLSIEHLSAALGVSRGSFYWHFADRSDFVHALLDYWHETYTLPVAQKIGAEGGDAEDKLRRLILAVHDQDLSRFDMPLRVWASHNPEVATLIERTDQFRMDFVRNLFADMGFEGRELDVRARSCIAYLTLERRMFENDGDDSLKEDLDDVFRFFAGQRRKAGRGR